MKRLTLIILAMMTSVSLMSQTEPITEDSTHLEGNWNVKVKQEFTNGDIKYEIKCTFKQIGNEVIGQLTMDLTKLPDLVTNTLQKEVQRINVNGHVSNGLLSFRYSGDDPDFTHFGSAVVKVESKNRLIGKFVGYGPVSQKVITGEMIFSRVEEVLTKK